MEELFHEAQNLLHENGMGFSGPSAREIVAEQLAPSQSELEELFGNGPLEDPLRQKEVTEILVNGHAEIWVEKRGALEKMPYAFASEESLRRWIRRVLAERGRKVDHRSPFADCTLSCGSRIHVAISPASRKGSCVSIRKFREAPWTLDALEAEGALSRKAVDAMKTAVFGRKNIFLSGGTGTGKTSLLAALLKEAPPNERILALEDISEIRLDHPHFLSLEGRPANQEGEGEVTLSRLLREALRMRPDRIVVGECRGPEALDLLLALNTGHAGSMGTIHANSPRDALQRIQTLSLLASENLGEQAVKQLILGAIHYVGHLERVGSKRRLTALVELKGLDEGRFLLREIAI